MNIWYLSYDRNQMNVKSNWEQNWHYKINGAKIINEILIFKENMYYEYKSCNII